MNAAWRILQSAMVIFCCGCSPVVAQIAAPTAAPRTYECSANAHCSIYCQVDGEKQVQTGSAKTVTITPIAANNYLVELVEQNGHVQFAYLAGAKVVCNVDGLTKKSE